VTSGPADLVVPLPPVPQTFTKRRSGAPAGFFAAEARGLAWLAAAGAVDVPAVVHMDEASITMTYVNAVPATRRGAERFGRALADLHDAGADHFGAPWPGFIGTLPMSNVPSDDWPSFYAEHRVLAYLRPALQAGAVSVDDAHAIEHVVDRLDDWGGPPEAPSRLHGDLWSGNVLFSHEDSAWVVDPAAHGGHRETDLAMLALFGLPYLDIVLAAYHEHRPLAPGFADRVGLHQLHPLLVHAVLFGGSYGRQAGAVARRYLGG
jgi:fructosamine-3-kinase